MKLFASGAYLVDGTELVEAVPGAEARVKQLTGKDVILRKQQEKPWLMEFSRSTTLPKMLRI